MHKSSAALLIAACLVAYGAFAPAPARGEEAASPQESSITAGHGETMHTVAGDAEAGQSKAAPCAACHGQDGNSPAAEWPKLAGQHPGYLVDQLKQFKSGERQNAIMQGMAAPLSEQDMRDIAAFYADQTIEPGVADDSMVELGEKVYRAGNAEEGVPACIACHGPTGSGIPGAGYPAIGGQHAQYVLTQLQLYAEGERQGGNQIMTRVADRLSEEEMQAVSSYVEGLHLREGAFDAPE